MNSGANKKMTKIIWHNITVQEKRNAGKQMDF